MKPVNTLIDHEHINWNRLEMLIRKTFSDIPDETMKIKKFSEGYSNHTYLLSVGSWESVLRRPPFGEIPAKAHDIEREYRILSKLHGVYPLAPKPYLYSEDPDIMGRHFYLMEKKQGVVINEVLPNHYGPSEQVGPAVSKGIIHSLVELQQVDYQKANLMDIGKPEGYLERQVHGWIKRYAVSKTNEFTGVEELEAWLIKNMAATVDTTIVHNDFKLNNLVLDPYDPGIVKGVLDWEMATIGDPMTDIGAVLAYWGEKGDPDMGISVVTNQSGFFSRREMAELYAQVSGRDIKSINFYVAFGFYKLAVILQQLYYRWKKGATDDHRFASLHIPIANLFEMANLTRENRIL
ncbi:phosphotransferase family protein [Neobacillus dielmonensis]|uniref:phosphotransferase family protein n=1 Tax=Neobacillus dielmonensis TaxID=1347369 RepID=UPI0005AB53C5|nr:phosphotransferase family protein [Neobacillus dielmonensis]